MAIIGGDPGMGGGGYGGGFNPGGQQFWGGRPPVQNGFGPPGSQGSSPQGPAPGQFGPAPWQQFGGVPYINPNDPSGWVGQYSQLLAQSQLPYLQQGIASSDQDYASRGLLYGGAAGSAADNLRSQYMASIAAGTAPLVNSAMGFQQADTMYNADSYGNVVGRNMDAYNGGQNALFNAYMGTYGGPSAGQGIYQGATGALGSTYGDVYGQSQQAQNSMWGNIFSMAPYFVGG